MLLCVHRFSSPQPFNVLEEQQAEGLDCLCHAVALAGGAVSAGAGAAASKQVGGWVDGAQRECGIACGRGCGWALAAETLSSTSVLICTV